jgi:hypothetical protein
MFVDFPLEWDLSEHETGLASGQGGAKYQLYAVVVRVPAWQSCSPVGPLLGADCSVCVDIESLGRNRRCSLHRARQGSGRSLVRLRTRLARLYLDSR